MSKYAILDTPEKVEFANRLAVNGQKWRLGDHIWPYTPDQFAREMELAENANLRKIAN